MTNKPTVSAGELRIGNILQIPVTNKSVELVGIERLDNGHIPVVSDFKSEYRVSWLSMSPITLTEKLLIKAGFEKFDNGCISATFCIGKNPITNDYLFQLVWLKDYTDENFEPYPFYKNGYHTIKYLHQLQNLYFALTGQELTIEL